MISKCFTENNKRILSISDNDMDGVTCQIIIGNIFNKNNIDFITVSNTTIDKVLENITYDWYSHIFITDVSPSLNNKTYIKYYDKFILMDHHETSINLHDPSKMKYVNIGQSSSLITYNYFIKLGADLSYLSTLVELVNDYDLWTNKYSESKELARLFYHYKNYNFRKRFFDGHIKYNKEELKIIKQDKKSLKKILTHLKIKTCEFINACIVYSSNFINEIADNLLNEGYDLVFIVNNSNNVSIRNNNDDINIGKLINDLSNGGGHKKSAAFSVPNNTLVESHILKITKVLYQKYPTIRK